MSMIDLPLIMLMIDYCLSFSHIDLENKADTLLRQLRRSLYHGRIPKQSIFLINIWIYRVLNFLAAEDISFTYIKLSNN